MRSIHSEIEIKASPEKVWSILMDFDKYPEWNPFIQQLSGEAREGGKLHATLHQPDSKPMKIAPTCLVAESDSEFRWQGHFIVPGIFDGEHIFKLKGLGDERCKFVQSENFKGLLLPFFWKMLNTKTIAAFEEMNKALKKRAES